MGFGPLHFMQTVYLSKRNLLTLLSKLERLEAGDTTECTIIKYADKDAKYTQSMPSIKVVAIPDDVAYAHRPAGAVVEADEVNVTKPVTGVISSSVW